MTTIVVHGTMTTSPAQNLNWWWRSWDIGGFLNAMAEGMTAVEGYEDIWKIHGTLVEHYDALRPKWSFWTGRMGQFSQYRGYFMWVGGDSYAERDAGAQHLAHYLSTVRQIAPDEPIRIVAHSHGCNVVKKASSHRKLSSSVFIDKAVFLACPHFETHLVHNDEWFYPYQLDPDRFGEIINLYSENDTVQTTIAESLPSWLISTDWREWTPPTAHRTEQDPDTAYFYEDYHIQTMDTGIAAHAAMHGETVGRLIGLWLEGADTFDGIIETIRAEVGEGPLIAPVGDNGEI